jgi:signal transduction histidine kinase/CheY-like chemotaxis protein
MTEEQSVSLEVRARSPGAPDKLLAIAASPLRDANGVAGGVALLRDVTQQRALEQQLQHSQKMDAIGRFAAGVVHDFNNLLSVIQSYAQLILSGASEGQRVPEDLGQIVGASDRAAALTRQLLAFCRREELKPKLLELNPIITNVEKMLRRILGADIALSTALASDLGVVRADAGQIDQIVLNLAVNARDAMPRGGRLAIETANQSFAGAQAQGAGVPPGEYVMLAVTDTGTGMDADTQRRIFEPFFTTKEVGKGTGLGLSTVYGIVQQARGHIAVDSVVGQGTTFRVYFPRAVGQPSSDDDQGVKRSGSDHPGTILLVEDNEAVRMVAARILRGGGHTVFETSFASEARRLCQERPDEIDLLLFDVVMPQTSGPTLAAELGELCPNARVLFMSGYSGSNSSTDGSWRSRATFLEKPFTPATLLETVRQTLAPRER